MSLRVISEGIAKESNCGSATLDVVSHSALARPWMALPKRECLVNESVSFERTIRRSYPLQAKTGSHNVVP